MSSDLPLADELSAVYARMSGLLLSQQTVDTALQIVTSLARETIPGTVGAGVTLVSETGEKTSAAATDPLVERADDLQYELNQGPCLSAWAQREVVRIDDIATERRWPNWTASVAPLGLTASLSAPLVAADISLGAMKVYGDGPGVYDARAETLLVMLAAQAAILLANVQSYQRAAQLSEDLKNALRSRDAIGMAKGILMARDGIDAETAFSVLAGVSQRENKKLRDVAQAIVESAMRRRR